MNLSTKIFAAIFIFGFFTISCNKDNELTEPVCELEITLEPVCSFNPKLHQEVKFPVRVLQNGNVVTHPDYNFNWDVNPNFSGSAISVSYADLPLKAIVTENSTDCSGEAILDVDYWD